MRNFSKVLIVSDENINVKNLRKSVSFLAAGGAHFFPLFSNEGLTRRIEETLISISPPGKKIKLLESAKLIDEEVDALREKVSKWSADIGNYEISGKSLKERFLLPKERMSTWWFSPILEKNTFKTELFFRLAQLNAIDKIVATGYFDLCVFSSIDQRFSHSIDMVCKRYSLQTLTVPSIKPKPNSFKAYIKSYLRRNGISYSFFRAVYFLGVFYFRALKARLIKGPIGRVEKFDNSLMFISYFPRVDKEAAQKGILKNKYALPLQKKLSDLGKRVIWIWLYTFMDGYTYKEALRLAKKFMKNGETNFFIYEFMSFGTVLKSVFLWLSQMPTYFKSMRLMPKQILYGNLSAPEGSVLIKYLMNEFSVGWERLEGILYYEAFKKIFSRFSHVSHCIYYLEMQTWEKALNAAKELKAPQVKSVGFQHGGISRNYFFYFHHLDEMNGEKESITLPLPDILTCNGEIPLGLMREAGYPNIKKVEAIRHLYLCDLVNERGTFPKKENIVLIMASVKREETQSMISMFYEAFPKKPRFFQIWLKSHPTFPIEDILKELRINARDAGYIVKDSPIDELLKPVKILFVGTSTATIEALALGCKIISPVFSNTMVMNHLKGFEDFYENVYNPTQLRETVERIIKAEGPDEDFDKTLDFVSRYWCLDKSLHRWEEVLS